VTFYSKNHYIYEIYRNSKKSTGTVKESVLFLILGHLVGTSYTSKKHFRTFRQHPNQSQSDIILLLKRKIAFKKKINGGKPK